MAPKSTADDLLTLNFENADAFESFLEREHLSSPGIFLKFAKKGSNIPSVTPAEAVQLALCFGWIDGRANALDNNWWTVRYTPRRPKSIWSKKNVDTVAALTRDGRMRQAGIECVEQAKKNGNWDRAYSGPSNIQVPDDFAQLLRQNSSAADFWDTLNKSKRYSVLWRIETASANARSGRIESLVECLGNSIVPGDSYKSKKRPLNSQIRSENNKMKSPVLVTKSTARKVLHDKGPKATSDPPRREGLRRR